MLYNKPFPLEGGGIAEKSFLYVQDLAEATQLICEKGEMGETYNVGANGAVSMRAIVEEICDQLGKNREEFIDIKDGRVGEDRKYWIDSSKIKNELGWEQRISLEEGISRMIAWCEKYKEELMADPDYFVLRA
jgi:dTDP-glucose 4,6-dehydratase